MDRGIPAMEPCQATNHGNISHLLEGRGQPVMVRKNGSLQDGEMCHKSEADKDLV
jgi:hypothetical protein